MSWGNFSPGGTFVPRARLSRGNISPGGTFVLGEHFSRGHVCLGGTFLPGARLSWGNISPGGTFVLGEHFSQGHVSPGGTFIHYKPKSWTRRHVVTKGEIHPNEIFKDQANVKCYRLRSFTYLFQSGGSGCSQSHSKPTLGLMVINKSVIFPFE